MRALPEAPAASETEENPKKWNRARPVLAARRILRKPRVIVTEVLSIATIGLVGAVVPQEGVASARAIADFRESVPLAAPLVDRLGLDRVFTSAFFVTLVLLAGTSLTLVVVELWQRWWRRRGCSCTEASFARADFRRELVRISRQVPSRGRRGAVPSGVFDPRGAEAYSTVRRAPRGEKTPLGAVHRRPQQEAGEICGLDRRALSGSATERTVTIRSHARLGLLGSPFFHTGLLLLVLAGLLRALLGASAVVDLVEGEVLPPDHEAWAAQWPGRLGLPFELKEDLRLDRLAPKRYPNGKLMDLTASVTLGGPPVRSVELAINRPLRLGSRTAYLDPDFGPAALVELAEGEGAHRRLALLLRQVRPGVYEGEEALSETLALRFRALMDGDGRPEPRLEMRLFRSGDLMWINTAPVGARVNLPSGGWVRLIGLPLWARLRGTWDRALPLVYAGVFLLVAGAALLFLVVPVDTMVIVKPCGEREIVTVALRAHRYGPLMAERFERLVASQEREMV